MSRPGEGDLPSVDDLQLEVDKLQASASAERGELFILHWLASCEKAVATLPEDIIRAHQSKLTTSLLSLITPPSPTSTTPTVKPGRPARSLISRILILLFQRGELKGLFDLGQALLKGIVGNDVKGAQEKEKEWRVASAFVLGEVWTVYGNQVMSLFVEVIMVTTKVFRSTSFPVILRCAALTTLRKAIAASGKSMSDQTLKDTIKALRASLSDKAGAIARESAECLLAMSATTNVFATLSDLENILTPSFKALEAADHVTRLSLSHLIAGLLSSTQIEGSAAPVPKKKKQGEEDEDDAYPTIGGPSADQMGPKTMLTPQEMLAHLSTPYNKAATTRKVRNAIVHVYADLLTNLSSNWVENYYPVVLQHLISEIGCGAAAGLGWSGWNARAAERTDPSKARYDALAARKAVGILLRDIISGRLLSEPGQIMALREIGSLYLKKWPSLLATEKAPSKQALLIALDETSGLLTSLGCAPTAVQEAVYDSLVRLVSHPSHSVQISASWALRTFCNVSPTKLSSTIVSVVDLLNKDLALLATPTPAPTSPTAGTNSGASVHRRAVGHSHALAALINLIPHQPLYVSFDISTKCMSLAIQLLKQSGSHELSVSGVEIQVAWIIVAALMSLGPNFVRLHLPQLLILWRNALPKPTSKDASAATVRGENEWKWLLHIRECTLGAIYAFLRHNGPNPVDGGRANGVGLVNEDVGRRLVLLLSNGLAFATSFVNSHANVLAEQKPATSSDLQLLDRDFMLRRRLYQCFVALGQNPATQPFQINLLTQVVALFSDPDKYTGENALAAAVAASNGTFTTVWDENDGYGFGVTSLMQDGAIVIGGDEADVVGKTARLNRDLAEASIEDQLRISVLGAAEHDPLVLSSRHHSQVAHYDVLLAPPPPASGLVDAAVELFALYFPLQETSNQLALLLQILNNIRSPRMEKNPGRRMAVLANSITGILGALRMPSRKAIEGQVGTSMREIVKEALLHHDARLRAAGAESLGRLASQGGTGFMASQIQFCVNQVVSNTDPDNRAGCALAFGEIYSHVGSLAAGPVLKTIVDVLLSLAADPHPLVHFYALQALSQVINSASLSYAPFTNSTLGMICKLYMQDTHEPEGGSPGSVNLRGDLPAYQAFCRVIDALVGVLGPELQESERVRELVLILLREFTKEPDEGITVEAIKATQHFLIFAPKAMELARLVSTLRVQLASTRRPLKVAAVNSVYQLVQRDAALMSKHGGDRLVQELFALLDDDPSIEGVRDAIMSWLRQTADANPNGWIDLCQRIMSRSSGTKPTAAPQEVSSTPMMSFGDEESQGLGLDSDGGPTPGAAAARTTSRWRTQLFALQCLHEVFITVAKSGRTEHFDIARARAIRANRRGLLVTRVSDLIKMAFTASTAQVMEIRLEGLVVLRDVIESFSKSRDLDFEEALLLDQYQAPIAAALTPAFAADSYPEVLASAIQVCAVFVGSGVVKEIGGMGRILKLLTAALESCRESDMSSLGDVKDLSSTAAVMLKTSIFAAWAQFQIASVRQPYLVEVIRPHLPLLCPFWTATLREYARVRTDPDATSSDSGAGGAAFDSVYSGLSRETALPFYERSWPQMLHAVGTLLKSSNPHMLLAVDGIDSTPSSPAPPALRTEPALFFYVLLGLSFEALCTAPPPSGTTSAAQVQVVALEAMAGLCKASVSGGAVGQDGLFEEICNLCYRLAITEPYEVKEKVGEIVKELASNFVRNGQVQDDTKMLQCLRVATCVLREAVPSSSSATVRPTIATLPALVSLLKSSLSNLAFLADLHTKVRREELYAITFHFYSQLLKEELDLDAIGPTLPALKDLCDRGFRPSPVGKVSANGNGAVAEDDQVLAKVVNGLLSSCLQNIEGVRSRRSPAAVLKTSNNLLASVLLLTSLPSDGRVKVGRAAVEHCCYLIEGVALGGTEAAPSALHCLLSLLLSATRTPPPNPTIPFCVGLLVPGLIEFVVREAERGEGSEKGRADREKLLGEVVKALMMTLGGVKEGLKTASLSILLPLLLLLLSPTPPSPPPFAHTLALNNLLALASSSPTHFRAAASGLTDEQRQLLEGSIRAAVGKGDAGQKSQEKPQISLKSFG